MYETYILIIHNALHIVSMKHHLVSSFIMGEGGVVVNYIPTMYYTDPTINDQNK